MENNNRRALRLPEFWVTDSVAWFAHVEAHFELENLTSQQHRYFHVVKSLSQDSLRLIKDILVNPHPTTPYDILKDCAAGFALLNLPKGKSLGRSKPETNSSNEQAH